MSEQHDSANHNTQNDDETVVRHYLQSLKDPSALIDNDKIAKLKAKIDSEQDPIAKLRLMSDLERAENIDTSHVEHSFIRCAKQWADANEISVAAFRNLGVPETVLRAAGMVPGGSRKPGRPKAERAPRGNRGPRSGGNVTIEQVKAHVATLPARFTLNDVAAGVGASSMTIRKAVTEMVDAGTVNKLGPAIDHGGRGRAPIEYQLVG